MSSIATPTTQHASAEHFPVPQTLHPLLPIQIRLMIVTLPDGHPPDLRPGRSLMLSLDVSVDQRARAITHRLVGVPFSLDAKRLFVALVGLRVRQADDAVDYEDQEDDDPDHHAGDCAAAEVGHTVVERRAVVVRLQVSVECG